MSYILYIPNGGDSFSCKNFTSLKELIVWAVTATYDAPTSDTQVELPVSKQPSLFEKKPSLFEKIETTPLLQSIYEYTGRTDLSLCRSYEFFETLKKEGYEIKGKEFKEFIEWSYPLDNKNIFINAVINGNWPVLAANISKAIFKNGFREITPKDDLKNLITKSEYKRFLQAVTSSLSIIGDELIPESLLSWDKLPKSVFIACNFAELSLNSDMVSGLQLSYDGHFVIPSIPLTENYFKILKFFKQGKQHQSWNRVFIDTQTLDYKNVGKTVNFLVTQWWSGEKSSDEIREFIMKAIITQTFTASSRTNLGSSEFRDTYNKILTSITELPTEFVTWATKGTTFANCKKVLGELGIQQVRKAEGQTFCHIYPLNNEDSRFFTFMNNYEAIMSDNEITPFNQSFEQLQHFGNLPNELFGVSARAYSRKIDISEPAIPSPLNTHSIDPYTTTSTSDWIMSTIQPDKHIKE